MSVAGYIKDLFVNPAKYTKFWIAFVTAALNAVTMLIPDSPLIPILVTFIGSFGVFALPNKK